MVLHFKERAKQPRYIALNTEKHIYVTGDAAKAEHAQDNILVSSDHFDHIYAETQFCGYDWAESLEIVTCRWSTAVPMF